MRSKSAFLFVLGNVQKDFDHAVAVLVQVFFIAADLAVALFKKSFLLSSSTRGAIW